MSPASPLQRRALQNCPRAWQSHATRELSGRERSGSHPFVLLRRCVPSRRCHSVPACTVHTPSIACLGLEKPCVADAGHRWQFLRGRVGCERSISPAAPPPVSVRFLHDGRESGEALPHAGVARHKPYAGARRQADHVRSACGKIRSCADSVLWCTRSRAPADFDPRPPAGRRALARAAPSGPASPSDGAGSH